MKKFLLSELGFFVVLTSLLMIFSLAPTVKRYLATPPDRVFDGLEFYSDDYSIYVSNMLQGQKGRWTLLDKHTTEPHLGTIIHDEYLLWGKYAGMFHIDQIKAYHLARLIFGIILLGMIYLLLKEIFSTCHPRADGDPYNNLIDSRIRGNDNNVLKRKLAFFLITFSTGFPIFISQVNPDALSFLGWQVKEHMDWLTEMDVFYRFVALPHYLLGNIFFVGALICFLKYLKSDNSIILRAQREVLDLRSRTINQYLISGAFCSLMMALIHPVALVSFMALLGLYLFFTFTIGFINNLPHTVRRIPYTVNGLRSTVFKPLIFFITSLLVSAPVMLYYRYLFTIPPWNHMAAWEGVTQYFVPLTEFASAIGPTFYLGIVGLIAMLFNIYKNYNNYKIYIPIVFFSWILSFFLLVYYSYPFLHVSQVRFMQVFLFIPFGVLASEGIFFLVKFLKSSGLFLLILLILLNALPVYYVSFLSKWYSYDTFSEIAYPYKKIVEGYDWLAKNSHPDDHVLTAFMAGTQIPYLSGNTVYVGHLWATLNRTEKEKLQYKFLGNQMSVYEAQAFFQTNKIKYFFDDYQAASYGIQPQNYPFLKPVFSNNMVTIYQALSTP